MEKMPARFKRVAAAFDEVVARVKPCESSSGSEHSPEDSADLFDLVESFIEREGKLIMEENNGNNDNKINSEVEKEGNSVMESGYWSDEDGDTMDTLKSLLGFDGYAGGDDDEKQKILEDITEFACHISSDSPSISFKRQLMNLLRRKGFDAGLCKSKWERFGRNPSGEHEYIDVNINGTRYIVEIFLAGEFTIARPTTKYLSLLGVFPQIFVRKPETLKQIVRLMCNAMRESMKSKGMHVAPWRRNGYMQAKWFSHYRRTVNETSAKSMDAGGDENAKNRSVGFNPSRLPAGSAISYHCKDDFASRVGMRVGFLTRAFNGGSGIKMEL